MPEVIADRTTVTWGVQAALKSDPDAWFTLPGFCYDSEERLNEVWNKHFTSDHEATVYRRVVITETVRAEVLGGS